MALCALAVFQLAAPQVAVNAQRRRAPRRPAVPAATFDARAAEIADEYLRGYYSFNPTEATAAGLHEYDAQLESRSAEAVAA
ncbi:MAG: hypothetical protein LC746_18180, partial [Acidobacteria bacterium]|nr:hypothetical protein [Acidobacteriota bacterium]